MAIKKEDTPASQLAPKAEPVEEPAKPSKFFMSEGVRVDLEIHGTATDPMTGAVLKRDPETGKVTATDRATGEVTDVA